MGTNKLRSDCWCRAAPQRSLVQMMSSTTFKYWHLMHCDAFSPVASRISGWLSSIVCNSASWDSDVDSDSSSGVTFAVDFAATRPTSLLAPVTGTPETPELGAAGARTATAGLKAAGARERGTAGTPQLPSDFLSVVVSGGGRSFVQGSGLAFSLCWCSGSGSTASSVAVIASEASSRPAPGPSAGTPRP